MNRKKYRKYRIYPFLNKAYQIFKNNPEIFVFKKMKNEGEYDPELDLISVDYRGELVRTIIHEIFHYLYSNWTEREVMREESRIINAMSVSQIKNFLKKFSRVL